jgi:AraC-like DNA-binding protein/TolB-like protein
MSNLSDKAGFLDRLTDIVNTHIANEQFGVNELAKEMGMSRSNLHRKLIKLTGKSASDFITEIRLARAKELLQDDTATISEIAYQVGFANPTYFSTVFKKAFHLTPGEYKRQNIGVLEFPNDDGISNTLQAKGSESRRSRIVSSVLIFLVVIAAATVVYIIIQNNAIDDQGAKVTAGEISLVVIPSENLESDSIQPWFSESMVDYISSTLSRLSAFKVSGRASTMKDWIHGKSMREIGEALNADYIVRLNPLMIANTIRIVVEVFRAQDGKLIWSDTNDFSQSEVFELDITKQIAAHLQTAISHQEREFIRDLGTEDPIALENYLHGNDKLKLLSSANQWRAIDYFKYAIELDSEYVQPYAGIASAYFNMTYWAVTDIDTSFVKLAREWALKAIDKNEAIGEPYFILAAISYMHEWDWKAAEISFKRGMELNPDYFWGCNTYAHFLYIMRRFEESFDMFKHASQLDPLDPWTLCDVSLLYYWVDESEKGYDLLKRILEKYPDNWIVKHYAALYYKIGFINDYNDEFLEEIWKMGDNDIREIPSFYLGDLGLWLIQFGRREEGIQVLNEFTRREDEGEKDVSYVWMGIIYNLLGDSEKAIDYLEKGYEHRELFLFIFNVEPTLEQLRENKRFQALLKKMGLEE